MKWTKQEDYYQCGEYTIRPVRQHRASKRGRGKSVHETVYVVAFRGQEFTWATETLSEAKEECQRHQQR